MTQEQENLIKEMLQESTVHGATNLAEQFLSEHVCIKKGDNRHPDADVLHIFFEDTTQILQHKVEWSDYWVDDDAHTGGFSDENVNWRIKPQEPVYEWQYKGNLGGVNLTTEYLTDEEFFNSTLQYDHFEKKEETKRERKV